MALFSLSLLRSRPERTISVSAARTITHTMPTSSMMTHYNANTRPSHAYPIFSFFMLILHWPPRPIRQFHARLALDNSGTPGDLATRTIGEYTRSAFFSSLLGTSGFRIRSAADPHAGYGSAAYQPPTAGPLAS